ncbi:pimeloyl-ACP methyl ester carboxylesterase [Curtobacterium sp. PhB25]|uniref:alpha/beta fold hydrolase n=1 Tax=unclassified Curtobacterium TaxID=257496 RepID=UPI0010430BD2|nr:MULTISPECIES: alpha/beta fold hydrolase [unclassified Curtobacterium]TCU50123.1 pimeloyl-ACP methyl ester carboxylesterase [Curtobacterium sp. PhB146]TCU87768.1 pimeloyl-ACP methyl ester carboxylesterase [Curtobacterium sp. PhB191]TDW46143.1 pimeloyl-ACP methyl ester carboxylesterase [Curtobacterium sp. PhB42]TDW55549.1 pimeloyl-ACP methyl ester carboxylesterase [Curtobacterium sp. PhB190]TDW72944.1 pimeloyl-ACP methyl ester carboxylesterase [Curtobacterium sp. PhB25]
MNSSLPEPLPVIEAGSSTARTALVLHGGGGPRTVAPIVGHLSATMHALAPTHPGWDGTARPESIASVAELAHAYLARLTEHGDRDVVVVGSSIGGWIALEMAVQAAADQRFAGLIGAVVVIDTVGAIVDGEPIADFFALDARGLAEVAWHDPERGYTDPADSTEEQRAVQQSNGRTMAAVAGAAMSDPTLLSRLHAVNVPTFVVWGASDRVVTPAYGRTVAAAVPGAAYAEIPAAGHLPHLESPEATWAAIDAFLS